MGQVFCTNCGKPNDDSGVFCTACGQRLAKLQETVPMQPTQAYVQPTQQFVPPVQPAQQYAQPMQPPYAEPQKKSNALIIALIAVIVVAAIAIVLLLLKPWEAAKSASSASAQAPAAQVQSSQAASAAASTSSSSATSAATPSSSGSAVVQPSSSSQKASEYVIADSNSRYYSRGELEKFSNEELYHARNEIYARHGRGFKNPDLQAYFRSKSWYVERYTPEQFDSMSSPLNDFERKNADLMLEIEKSRNSPYL